MKYLENEKLNKISAELSKAVLKDSHRIIEGRIEAYIMKRAGNDKKYAHALGQKYVAEIEDMQEELAATVERKKRRRRSNSESFLTKMMQSSSSSSSSNTTDDQPGNYFTSGNDNAAIDAKKSKVAPTSTSSAGAPSSTSISTTATATANAASSEAAGLGRSRAQSFDCTLDISPKTTVGDFMKLSTRKLMTDLILTLNASFPDYDFSTVKHDQFHKLHMDDVRKSIYEKLSEFASQHSSPNFLDDLWCAVNDVIELRETDVYSVEYEFDNEDSLWNFHYLFVNKSVRRIVLFTCSGRIDCNDDTTLICRSEDGHAITTVLQEGYYESDPQQVRYYSTTETQSESDDVDWNPSDNVAGGMSLEVAIGG